MMKSHIDSASRYAQIFEFTANEQNPSLGFVGVMGRSQPGYNAVSGHNIEDIQSFNCRRDLRCMNDLRFPFFSVFSRALVFALALPDTPAAFLAYTLLTAKNVRISGCERHKIIQPKVVDTRTANPTDRGQ